jgi:phosphoglycolate phosphatase
MISRPFCTGAKRGLRRLAAIARLAIVTDARRKVVKSWLGKNRVSRLFEALLCSEDVPEFKPSPKGINRVLKKLGVKPGEAFYVGDAQGDMLAARAAGVKPIGVLCGMASRSMLVRSGAYGVFANLDGFARWLE